MGGSTGAETGHRFNVGILEEPDDDTHRLVYADWLDEHGDPDRAEFIRVQCELTRLEGDDDPTSAAQVRMAALQHREAVLLGSHRPAWTQPLPEWARRWCGFQRGFVATVHASAALFLEHGAELLRVAPVQHLALDSVGHWTAALAASPLLRPLRSLLLANQRLDDAAARALAASPHLANLTLLNLDNNRLTADGAQALASATGLPRLARLQLGGNMLGPAGAEALADSLLLPGLTRPRHWRAWLCCTCRVTASAKRGRRPWPARRICVICGRSASAIIRSTPAASGRCKTVLAAGSICDPRRRSLRSRTHFSGTSTRSPVLARRRR
jgi:uncharacterized protein (TIGR02996 family)